MRWTWPSWAAVALGALAVVVALTAHFAEGPDSLVRLTGTLLLGGTILLAAGLHALQAAWSSCGDCCGAWGGCDCDHCEGCRGDDCCGACACASPAANGHEGHEGHGHDGGHSH